MLSQPGTVLGSRIWSLKYLLEADVQTEILDMVEDDCLGLSESKAIHRFLSQFLMGEVPIHYFRDALT